MTSREASSRNAFSASSRHRWSFQKSSGFSPAAAFTVMLSLSSGKRPYAHCVGEKPLTFARLFSASTASCPTKAGVIWLSASRSRFIVLFTIRTAVSAAPWYQCASPGVTKTPMPMLWQKSTNSPLQSEVCGSTTTHFGRGRCCK